MKITPAILEALRNAIQKNESAESLARRAEISKSNISRYLSGKVTSISDDNWNRLKDILAPYLPESAVVESHMMPPHVRNTIRNTPELRECIKDAMLQQGIKSATELCNVVGYDTPKTLERLLAGKINWFPDMLSSVLDNLYIRHDDAPMTPAERGLLHPEGVYRYNDKDEVHAVLVHYLPVISWAHAASYIDDMIGNNGAVMKKWNPDEVEETVPVPLDMRGNCSIFRVNGESMEPTIYDGDKLYCEEVESIRNIPDKKIVVVKFSDCSKYSECVVCKRFQKVENGILLTSDNPAGRSFAVDPKEIMWIGVVQQKSTRL